MHNFEKYTSPFLRTVWSYTDETWTNDDWRVVGTRKRSSSVSDTKIVQERKMSEPFLTIGEPIFGEAFYLTTSKKFENMSVNEIMNYIGDNLYLIEFGSGRMDIAYVMENIGYEKNNYVIIEADRGEDCGKIVGITNKEKYRRLLNRMNEVTKEVQPKRIFRKAMKKDLEMLKRKEELEDEALDNCKLRVRERELEMEVVGCEYQWDKHKLTFFFMSDKRIDFRELVKELYKVYKTRIWMCAVEKSKNCYLRELL
ncbi:hypothetical protein COBT_001007 [Conglomerata obtusa]